ncbi:hypothetical protein GCM10011331_06350 [Flavimobilis marinus]|uniref:Uncharacterized protein n=1 Tax=Flavimobilis marinus TaxID=285351 RepID=A0A1I2D2Z8_9MICO|nr:hypothetical protein [Flavimobilis marinus]GHG46368.1 hypothetical protein GCM10011331_06350 [Flavimobilis marinus]SFE74433.1 hypothetical protein SAMN04488035_0359 [Flavimobilis marinus]
MTDQFAPPPDHQPQVTTPPNPPVPPSPAPSSSAEWPPPARRPRPAWVLPVATGVVGLLLGAGGVGVVVAVMNKSAQAATLEVLSDAVDACDLAGASGITVADEGASLIFDTKGEEDFMGADYLDTACLFAELDMPTHITSHISQTTSMDGRQTEEWDDLSVSWSYHPDRGLDGVLTVGAD